MLGFHILSCLLIARPPTCTVKILLHYTDFRADIKKHTKTKKELPRIKCAGIVLQKQKLRNKQTLSL